MSQTKVTDALRNVTSVDATKLTGTVDATKLTGTIANARIPASAVTQHVTGYNDVSLRSDILKLAIHSGIDGNRAAFNLDDSFIDTFEDDTGITTKTTVNRDTTGEYVSSMTTSLGAAVTIFSVSGSAVGSGYNNYVYRQILQSHTATFHQIRATVTTTGAADVTNAGIGERTGAYGDTVATPVEFLWGGSSGASGADQASDWLTFTMTNGVEYIWTMLQGNATNSFYSTSPPSGNTSNANTAANGYTWNLANVADQSLSAVRSYYLMKLEVGALVDTTNATGTLISDAQTASTSRTSASGVIIYEDADGTNVLGTDLKVYFSCNNSAWTEASSYGTATTYSGTKKLVKLGATTCTAGTAIAMKAVWANQVATVAASQVLIAQNVGTAIGNMTSNGGLAAAFNGNNNQAYAQNSVVLTGSAPAFIGKDWGSGNTKTITGVKTWGSNETGYSGVGAATSHFLYGSNSAPTGTSDGTLITTLVTNTADVNGTNPFVYLTGIDATTAYRYHWLTITTPSSPTGQTIVCELEFYGDDTDGVVGKEARLHGWAINY